MKADIIGIIGVGLMGHGIASSIGRSGRRIAFVDHPGNQPTHDLVAAGAETVSTPAELAARCDMIVVCVTGSPQVEAVLAGAGGVIEGLRPGMVVIDCSTALPDSTRRMAALVHQAGGRMLDAPMTRTPKEAAEGRLNLLVGGDAQLFEECLPLLRTFAENITHVGPVGAGHVMKLVHNYVSLGFSAVLCEAAAAAGKAGIEPSTLQAVLAKGGGNGVVLDRLTPFILDGDTGNFRFSIANAAKDLGYYAAMAEKLGGAASIASAVASTYLHQVEAGRGDRFVPEMIELLSQSRT